ncbi:haloalkane dehalogenase [Micromonospora phytophila]|uniref:haloalkane dehalogenase n=1 Tax=Micromonospora phytophila TaxID=709888 RepID=UPI00202FD4A0|nr:haloalkane dehalogenase [Micromonospora phytophila]MCM0673349.1 haloalkane dehalogenase [Micromonospora phytophila]
MIDKTPASTAFALGGAPDHGGPDSGKGDARDRRRFLAGAAALTGGALLGPAVNVTTPAGAAPTSGSALADDPKALRTPDERFAHLPDYPFKPNYARIKLGDGSGAELRMHYLDERPRDPAKASGETVLLLHGNPSWSYLYRHVIPPLVAAGHRCVAPDLVGFGKSDKVVDRFAYTWQSHVEWLREAVFDRLDLRDVTMVCHDWGGMVGLLLLAQHPDRFRRVVASNTGLREGGGDLGPGWEHLAKWVQFTQRTKQLEPGQIVDGFSLTHLDPAVQAAYNAPYPDDRYLHGVRRFAAIIPITENDEANPAIRAAWKVLESLQTPFLCAFSAEDHVTRGDHTSLSGRIPGAQGQPHTAIADAAHFVQEDQAAEFAQVVADFISLTS